MSEITQTMPGFEPEVEVDPPLAETLRQAVPDCLNIYSFGILNLASYFAAVGPALSLLALHCGASNTYLSIMLAMMPATQIVQLYLAPRLEQWGIKRFMMGSLVLRNVFNLLLAALPFLAGMLGNWWALALLMIVMFGFDLFHGMGFSGWLTWINWLVPERWRGRYFSIEQMMSSIGQFLFSFAIGYILGKHPATWRFGLIFAIGAAAGWLSLLFIAKVKPLPRKTGPAKPQPIGQWVAKALRIGPFRRMLYVIICYQLMLSLGGFSIRFQKEDLGFTEDMLAYMGSVGPLGGVLSVYLWGTLADRFGSRPVMALGMRLVVAGIAYWLAVALGFPYYKPWLIMAVGFFQVAGMTGYIIAYFRYLLSSLPQDQVVFGTVIGNLTVQLTASVGPLLWGWPLDLLKGWQFQAGPLVIQRFTLLYGLMLLFALMAKFMIRRMPPMDASATPNGVLWHVISGEVFRFRPNTPLR